MPASTKATESVIASPLWFWNARKVSVMDSSVSQVPGAKEAQARAIARFSWMSFAHSCGFNILLRKLGPTKPTHWVMENHQQQIHTNSGRILQSALRSWRSGISGGAGVGWSWWVGGHQRWSRWRVVGGQIVFRLYAALVAPRK